MRRHLRVALVSLLLGSFVMSGPASANFTPDLPQVNPDGVLTGSKFAEAVRATRENQEFKEAVTYVAENGFDTANPETVVLAPDDETTLVLTFFNSVDAPETEAALIAHEHDGKGERIIIEFITVDRNALENAGTLNMDAFTVVAPHGTAAVGKRKYLSCMMLCIGVKCASKARLCRLIPHVAGMLACMIGVCGSKAKGCHPVCR